MPRKTGKYDRNNFANKAANTCAYNTGNEKIQDGKKQNHIITLVYSISIKRGKVKEFLCRMDA